MDEQLIDAFNKVFHKRGRYFDVKSLNSFLESDNTPDELSEFMGYVLELGRELIDVHQRRYKDLPKIHLAYLDNQNLGAIVDKNMVTKGYLIGLYLGTIPVLWELFSKMLTNPELFTWIGNISQEEAIKVNNPFITNWQVLLEFLENYPEIRVKPNDQDRIVFVQNLVIMAVYSIILHEIGHIVRGHVDYLKSLPSFKSSLPLTDESAQASESSPFLDYERQALEADADHFASFHGVQTAFHIGGGNDKTAFKRALEVWSFAVASTFRLFSLIPYTPIEKAARLDHPAASLRMLLLSDDAWSATRGANTYLLNEKFVESEIEEIIQQTFTSIQSGIRAICDDEDVLLLSNMPLSNAIEELQQYRNKMSPIYDNLMRKLRPFKFEFIKP
jgi:hypothetical protein